MNILQPGPAPAVSFNDVTSLDGRLTTGFKVYIDAQVQEFEQLDWYFTLLQACPDIPGELKSAVIRSRFEALPPERRTRVWATLFRVKIHVVDPRPYQDFIDAMNRRHLQSDDAPQQVRAAALERRAWAVQMLEQDNIFIAGSILRDSTACRTHRFAKYIEDEITITLDPSGYDVPELLDLQDFKCGTKGLVKKVAEWSTKSSAAFHRAFDSIADGLDDGFSNRFVSFNAVRYRMVPALLDVHAFDKGDQQQMRVLEHARNEMLRSLTEHDPLTFSGRMTGTKPYLEVDSSNSFFTQAADLAAGIAAMYYEREGLVSLATRFEFVSFNGKRVGISEAEEIARRRAR